ncbi:MAG: hypothetical protein EP338_06305 [Bacteroidetes bacterium]|nr:MAG: hypothetical protein EP338_06305 [Bacteroidota bacterium]
MKTTWIVLIVVITILGTACSGSDAKNGQINEKKGQQIEYRDSIVYQIDTVILRSQKDFEKNHFYSPDRPPKAYEDRYACVMDQKALVFEKRDNSSRVLDTLKFKHPLQLLSGHFYGYDDWVQVEFGKGKIGFVRGTAISEFDVSDYRGKRNYLIRQSKFKPYDDRKISIMIYDQKNPKKVLGVTEIEMKSSYYRANMVQTALKSAENMLCITHFRASCPGTEIREFYRYSHGKMHFVGNSMATGEMGEYTVSTLYLPIRFENGKIRHFSDANPDGVFNWQTGELNHFQLPDSLQSRAAKIAVRVDESGQQIFGKDYQQRYDKEGSPLIKIFNKKVSFYEWNGRKLVKL